MAVEFAWLLALPLRTRHWRQQTTRRNPALQFAIGRNTVVFTAFTIAQSTSAGGTESTSAARPSAGAATACARPSRGTRIWRRWRCTSLPPCATSVGALLPSLLGSLRASRGAGAGAAGGADGGKGGAGRPAAHVEAAVNLRSGRRPSGGVALQAGGQWAVALLGVPPWRRGSAAQLLLPDDAPQPHDAQPAHGLPRREAVVLHHVECDESARAPPCNAPVTSEFGVSSAFGASCACQTESGQVVLRQT
jgi:hypothetical protein